MTGTSQRSGYAQALGAYFIWGFMPLFFKQLAGISPVEIVAHRIVWSLGLLLIILWGTRRLSELKAALTDPATRRLMLASSALIGSNWLIYIWAIDNAHIVAASLGYYINPLLNVVLGMLLFGERLTQGQRLAVVLAMLGVAVLAFETLATIWISLSLAGSFALYGAVRKHASVGSLPGLTVETALLFPAGLGYALWAATYDPSPGWGYSTYTDAFMIAGGAMTALPLLLFASAARKLPLSTLGFIQYIGPTIQFLLGVFLYREPFTAAHAICFALIWTSIAVFSADSYRRSRRPAAA